MSQYPLRFAAIVLIALSFSALATPAAEPAAKDGEKESATDNKKKSVADGKKESAADEKKKSAGGKKKKPKPEKVILTRVPPMSPEESLAAIEIADGFRIEIVASEPLVVDPVAMAFDERGRLYVVEMRDYSEQDKERLGQVRVLTDPDGDGRYNAMKLFATDLSWPTAIACYDGGVFVGAAPDIYYLKDINGDDIADIRTVVYRGFSRINVQGMLNSFLWGLDHRIWGSASTTGADITWAVRESRPVVSGTPDPAPGSAGSGDPRRTTGTADPFSIGLNAKPLELRNRDFAVNPKTLEMTPTTGGGQHGMTFNHWFDRFVCHNSDHLQAIVFEERYLARNPYQSVVSARRSIAADGPQAEVFRISPIEKWREARTKMRVEGSAPGPIEGGGRSAGYFTSATGITAYEGGLWNTGGEDWVLVADVGSNLIHRKRLVPSGVTYVGERIDKNSEFIRSRDIWFRPVQMTIGPEGALYVADMYREVIEHPTSLPAELKSQLDLTSGRDRGRIYRVVPKDYRYAQPTSLAKATPEELVKELDSANQWRRTTALRLLYERQDKSVIPVLRTKNKTSERPEGRIATLYALESLSALTEGELVAGMADSNPQVRRHALRLSEPLLNSSARVRQSAISLVGDADAVVRFQLALSLGECSDAQATPAIAQILSSESSDEDIREAALTSIATRAGDVLKIVLQNKSWLASPPSAPVLSAIVAQIVRQRREADLAILIAEFSRADASAQSESTIALLKALSRATKDALASGNSPAITKLRQLKADAAKTLVQEAHQVLKNADSKTEARLAAIENLRLDIFDNARGLLEQLLSPQEPTAVHAAVLATCAGYESPKVADFVLSQWDQFAPEVRAQATELLLRRPAWALSLARYLADKGVALTTLQPAHVARLENYPSPKVKEIIRKLRGKTVSEDRKKVYDDYREIALAGGDAEQGKTIFEKNCAACHQLGATGHAVGPNLAAMVNRGLESVLQNVLVPNGEVDPRFLEYVVVTADGDVIPGLMAGETATAVTLRAADNKTTTILRVDIDEMHNTGKSLMPEGFEKVIDKPAMASLLSYLKQAAAAEGAAK